MENEFEILSAKVLGGEASAEERTRLDEFLARSEEHRREYAALKSIWESLQTVGPVTFALDAPPAAIPPDRLLALQRLVQNPASAQQPTEQARDGTRADTPGEAAPVPGPRFRFTSRWLARWGWAVGIAALLLAFLTFLALRPAQNEPAGSSHRPAAYAVIQDGSAKIIRGSQEVPASQVEALEPLDELVLPPGARATLVLAGGIATLNGPWRGVISSAALTQKAPDSGASADRLKLALFEEPHELRGAGLLASTRSGSTLRIFSPAGVTAWVNPLIIWDSQPGKSYEVTVTDAFDSTAQPVSASAVFSPLEFTQIPGAQDWPLRPGGLYRIRVQESGNPFILAERTFQVADPGSLRPTQVGVAQLLLAHEILAGAPARVGDAMAELLTIPNNLARTPLAVRLKLLAFGQLGDAEGFAAMLALLQAEE